MRKKTLCFLLTTIILSIMFLPPAAEAAGEHLVKVVSASQDAVVALTSSGRVLSWGSNAYGNLGVGSLSRVEGVADITGQFDGRTVVDIYTNTDYMMAFTADNHIYIWGGLFHGLGKDRVTKPTDITAKLGSGTIRAISSYGGSNTLLVTNKNKVFLWGQSAYGAPNLEMGQAFYISDITAKFNGANITNVGAGFSAYFVQTLDNRLLVWGSNAAGALGTGNTISNYTPSDITNKFDSRIVDIWLLGETFYAVTTSKTFYMWGRGLWKKNILTPTPVTEFGDDYPTEMFGDFGVIAHFKSGKYMAWGDNQNGQLGVGYRSIYPNDTTTEPAEVIGLPDAKPVTWQMFSDCTKILMDDGKLYGAGRDYRGTIGLGGDNEYFLEFQSLPFEHEIKFWNIGFRPSIAITDDNQVWAWGWNEFGNCLVESDGYKAVMRPTNITQLLGLDAAYQAAFRAVAPTVTAKTGERVALDIICTDTVTGEQTEALPSDFIWSASGGDALLLTENGNNLAVDTGIVDVYAVVRSKQEIVGENYDNPDYADWVVHWTVTVSEGDVNRNNIIDVIKQVLTFDINVSL